MPIFWKFWDQTQSSDSLARARLFREQIITPNYEIYQVIDSKTADDALLLARYLRLITPYAATMRTMSAQLTPELLDRYRKSFDSALPGMKWDGNVYFLPSLNHFDGMVEVVKGQPTLFFGVDRIAEFHGAKGATLAPLFHHELFHLYHRGIVPGLFAAEGLYAALWCEGLAVYVSQVLNPQAGPDDLLTSQALIDATTTQMPKIARALNAKLNSPTTADYNTFFVTRRSGNTNNEFPERCGYYVGYLVAKELAKRHSLKELTTLKGEPLRVEIQAALQKLETGL